MNDRALNHATLQEEGVQGAVVSGKASQDAAAPATRWPRWSVATARRRAFWALAIGLPVGLGAAIVFMLKPPVDLRIAQWFYDPAGPVPFPLGNTPVMKAMVGVTRVLSQLALLAAIGWLVYCWRRRPRGDASRIRAAILVVSLALGPGLVVNNLLKEHWGRARPREVVQFGGTQQYSPPWVIADQCHRNCSFTSGHAAAGFAPLVGWFVMRSPWWIAIGLGCGLAMSVFRMSSGAHFLSDALFSGWIVWICAALVTLWLTRSRRRRA